MIEADPKNKKKSGIQRDTTDICLVGSADRQNQDKIDVIVQSRIIMKFFFSP